MSSQDDLMVDLQNLTIVGTYELPKLADLHADMSFDVSTTVGPDTALFQSPGRGTTATFAADWSLLRDALQRFAADGSVHLANASAALVQIAHDYADTDGAGSAALTATMAEYAEEVGPEKPIPEVSDPVYPGGGDDGDGTGGPATNPIPDTP